MQERSGPVKKLSAPATVRERVGFQPDEAQARVLESGAKRGILNCTRPWGKSMVTALMALERAWREAGSLTLVDEAARVPGDVYRAVRPMLAASGGGLWLMSTPNGKRGFFWEAWERGGAEWERVQVTAYDCPRIPREILEEEQRALRERSFRQEYLCELTEAEDGVFDADLVRGAMAREFGALGM